MRSTSGPKPRAAGLRASLRRAADIGRLRGEIEDIDARARSTPSGAISTAPADVAGAAHPRARNRVAHRMAAGLGLVARRRRQAGDDPRRSRPPVGSPPSSRSGCSRPRGARSSPWGRTAIGMRSSRSRRSARQLRHATSSSGSIRTGRRTGRSRSSCCASRWRRTSRLPWRCAAISPTATSRARRATIACARRTRARSRASRSRRCRTARRRSSSPSSARSR